MTEYRYGMRLRGFSIGCQPMNGLIRRADSTDKRYYDILVYDRPLTEKELRDYELDDLQEPELDPALENICEDTGTSKAGIRKLFDYYIKDCGWTEDRAVEYICELFDNGTIDIIKSL